MVLAAVGLIAGSILIAAEESSRPTMTVKACEDFTVTGDGKSPAWETTEWVALSKRPDSPHDYETRVKALYSKTGLYFLIDGTDSKLTATFKNDYDTLWMEDVFEVFLWPQEKYPVYFEYEISPLGRELPILIPNFDGKIMGWLPWMYEGGRKIQKAVSITGGDAKSDAAIKGWRAELFFPYELLKPLENVPPKAGSKWRANFYRMDYDGGKQSSWDWARVGPSFHEFEKFGTLVFE